MTRPMPHFTDADKVRFFSKLLRIDTGCLEWQGQLNENGYGQVSLHIGDRWVRFYTHRAAYFIDSGVDPADLCVLHRCDNRRCCEREHLFLGTRGDNHADMRQKGRAPRGETHGRCKLTTTDVLEIRASGAKGRDLARSFGVSPAQISRIRMAKKWTHI